MHTFADLCAALFSSERDEADIAARLGTTVDHVHAFYCVLADLGLVVLEDRITGTWTRTTTGPLKIEITPWKKLSRAAIEPAAERFAAFVGRPLAAILV